MSDHPRRGGDLSTHRLEWTWQDGSKTYSVPLTEAQCQEVVDDNARRQARGEYVGVTWAVAPADRAPPRYAMTDAWVRNLGRDLKPAPLPQFAMSMRFFR